MTNVEALKALYAALGGDAADVADATTITAVLNIIAAKYEGADDATTNAEAIANIADVAGNITPEPVLIEKSITENGTYAAADDNADGYSSVIVDVAQSNNAEFISSPTKFTFKSNIKSMSIPSGITAIDNQVFQNAAALDSINLPEGLLSIGAFCFAACVSLQKITIPSSVTEVGQNSFNGCTVLETITINKPEGSITGAPWGAPSTTQVVWTG